MIRKDRGTDPKSGRCFFKKVVLILLLVLGIFCFSSIVATPFISAAVFEGIAKGQPECESEAAEGRVLFAVDNPKGTVILAPGIRNGLFDRRTEAEALNKEGYNALVYYQDTSELRTLSDSVKILEEQIAYVRKESADIPIFLSGYSLGAYASAVETAFDDNIAGIIAIYGFDEANSFMEYCASLYVGKIPAALEYPFLYGMNVIRNGKSAVSGSNALKDSKVPALVIGNAKDSTVVPEEALYQKLVEDGILRKELILYENNSSEGHSIKGIVGTKAWEQIVDFLRENSYGK